jgi:quercetin dioxygenase-like cupin family protein
MKLDSRVLISDNVFVRMFVLPKTGDVHDGHAHTFNHITLLAKGIVEMRTQHTIEPPVKRTYAAPMLLVTPAGLVHEFEALTDDCVLCCIHAIRNGDDLDDIAPHEITPAEARDLLAKYPLIGNIEEIARAGQLPNA